MNRILFVLALALAGCASQPPQTVVSGVRTIETKVPVVKPCIDEADVPALPPTAMPPRSSGIKALSAGAAVDVDELAKLAKLQNALLRACATPTKEK